MYRLSCVGCECPAPLPVGWASAAWEVVVALGLAGKGGCREDTHTPTPVGVVPNRRDASAAVARRAVVGSTVVVVEASGGVSVGAQVAPLLLLSVGGVSVTATRCAVRLLLRSVRVTLPSIRYVVGGVVCPILIQPNALPASPTRAAAATSPTKSVHEIRVSWRVGIHLIDW